MENITLKLQNDDKKPLYEQLYRYIIGEIEAGRLKNGEKLPSKRAIGAHLSISQSTVETAYGMLAAEGYIRARAKSGYYVSADLYRPVSRQAQPKAPAADGGRTAPRYDLSTGAVDTGVFPYASWARLSREVVSGNPQLLQRGEASGDPAFRQALCEFLREYRGVRCDADQIIVGAGLEYLLNVLVQVLPENSVYGLEDPGYLAAWQVLRNHSRQIRMIPLDENGLREDKLRESGATVAFVTPSHQFPMGSTMPVGRRAALLAWAEEGEARFIVEDDYDSEFRYASRPIPAMQSLDDGGKVIYVGTFSRSIAPSIRVAYLVLPRRLLPVYEQRLGFAASTVSRFEQQTLAAFLDRGLYARHLRRAANLYRKKQQLLLEELAKIPGAKVSGAQAGLHFLLTIPGKSEEWLVERAKGAGVPVRGLSGYCRECPCPESTLVLGFAGLKLEEIPEAARALREAF